VTGSLPRVAILISGTGSNMCSIIDSAQEQSWPMHCALVLSDRPEAAGLLRATERGIATRTVHYRDYRGRRADFDKKILEVLQEVNVEWIVLAGFMRILGREFVETFPDRILNIHPSLLPKYPGLNTFQRALEAGDKIAGCTVHLVNEAVDAGPVLGQAEVPVLDGDTEDTLRARVLEQEHILYPAMVKRAICGDFEGR